VGGLTVIKVSCGNCTNEELTCFSFGKSIAKGSHFGSISVQFTDKYAEWTSVNWNTILTDMNQVYAVLAWHKSNRVLTYNTFYA
jgi:hypothetical protein